MSSRRFAAITASLLARKGEAAPSIVPEAPRAPILWSNDPRVTPTEPRVSLVTKSERADMSPVHDLREHIEQEMAQAPEMFSDRRPLFFDHGEKRHRISLALSQEEHERLGIVAVKKGLTRHQLMRDALDHYFEKLAGEYKSECACIATGGCKNGCDTAGE